MYYVSLLHLLDCIYSQRRLFIRSVVSRCDVNYCYDLRGPTAVSGWLEQSCENSEQYRLLLSREPIIPILFDLMGGYEGEAVQEIMCKDKNKLQKIWNGLSLVEDKYIYKINQTKWHQITTS